MPCEPNEKSVDKLEDAVYRKYPDPTEGGKNLNKIIYYNTIL